jgi:hypothetical protein
MSRRLLVTLALVTIGLAPWAVAEAHVQDRSEGLAAAVAQALLDRSGQPIRLLESLEGLEMPLPEQLPPPVVQPFRRINNPDSTLLTSLYVATGLTQALDIHSTLKALDRGGVESNPLLAPLTKNRMVFVAVKAAVAAGSIMAARRLAKKNKLAAIATLLAINVGYGLIAHHNYKVAGRLR